MARSFKELKRNRAADAEKIRSLTRVNLGTQKRTRLIRAGCSDSETLLHKTVAADHGKTLAQDYIKRLGRLSKQAAHERLRFVTVLHAVTDLKRRAVMRAVASMEKSLNGVFADSGIWMLGAVEIEIVNKALLRSIKSLGSDEARKLDVLEKLHVGADDSAMLVHFHGIADLEGSLLSEDQLRKRFKKVAAWRRSPYQIEMKKFFTDRTVQQNVRDIANYLTKGGNDKLRYNAGFGRELDDDFDAKVWRAGMGRADRGGETVPDQRGLTLVEIAFLDRMWRDLMNRKRNKRGYLTRISGR